MAKCQMQAQQAADMGLTPTAPRKVKQQEKKEEQGQLDKLDKKGAIELIVHVASSTLAPSAAFKGLYKQLNWIKFASNTTVQEVLCIKCPKEGRFCSYPSVRRLLSEAMAQSKGK